MRVSKFKGKDKAGNWHFGDVLHHDHGVVVIIDDAGKQHTIIPQTRCEFTGAYDCDGKEIFEGDIFTMTHGYPKNITFVVKYYGTAFLATPSNANYRSYTVDHFKNDCKVIGNIHDND
ncbi:MAG: hypothetical protein IJ797_08635 [Selenomonadaceae bacterium]|nr:hypothetical protein [Selenomonadaceae bacterium]